MKKLVVFIFSCFTVLKLYSQDLSITYEGSSKYSEEMIEAVPDLALNKNKYRYSLKLNSHESVFSRDSLLISKPYEQSRVEIWQSEQIYKNHQTDLWLKTSGAYTDGYGYQRKISEMIRSNEFQWSKTGIKKEILGFDCVEVVDNARTAYYATKIPIPDGPQYGIFGLPGLVLEYEDESSHWMATSILYSNDANIIIPDLECVSNESEIKMSLFDLKDLAANKAIRVDYATPVNKWIKFQTR